MPAEDFQTKSADSQPKIAERNAFIALVQSAIKKHQLKQPLTPQETRAWKKWEADEDERRGRRWLSSLTKKQYCEIVGRHTKVLNEQCDAYGVPLRGAVVDALEVLRWMHDFFAKHKHDLPQIVRGESGGNTPRDQLVLEQIEVYRRRVQLLENQIKLADDTLLPRVEVHELLVQLARVLRGAGERLDKQFGPQAASILDVALGDYDSVVARLAKSDEDQSQLGDATPAND